MWNCSEDAEYVGRIAKRIKKGGGGLSHLPTTFQSLINIFSTQLLANGRGGRGGGSRKIFSGHTKIFADIS